jgi:SAM-dependent methyltransferase
MRRCLSCGGLTSVAPEDKLLPSGWVCLECGWPPAERDGVAITAPALADTISGFDPASFSNLASIEKGHFWFEPRNRLITGMALRLFPQARSYMEIGCGTGFVLAAMAERSTLTRIVGSELHPRGLEIARGRVPNGRAEWIQMDARAIPAWEEFDLVGAYDVIEHIEEDETVLRQAHDSLRPGGGIIITVPQHPWLWSATDDVAHHVRRYRLGEIEGKLRAAGFEIVASTSYTSVLLPIMMAARMLSKVRGQVSSAGAVNKGELRPGQMTNQLMEWLLQLEVAATFRGVRWPVGGSRVVAARRVHASGWPVLQNAPRSNTPTVLDSHL